MRYWIRIALVTGSALVIGGCNAFSGGEEEPVVENVPVPVPVPEATIPAETEGEEAAAGFDDPTVAGEAVGRVPDELIASTRPEDRIQEIQRDRPDPFDLLQTRPVAEVPPPEEPPTPPTEPPSAVDGNGNPLDNGNGNGNGVAPEELLPPPPPQPETAQAVLVTGVVQIGNVPYAIVNAPNEPHSRYVRSGQRLSNGQVLVKRIELFPGISDPVVVLEELGIEVARTVGDAPAAAADVPEETPLI